MTRRAALALALLGAVSSCDDRRATPFVDATPPPDRLGRPDVGEFPSVPPETIFVDDAAAPLTPGADAGAPATDQACFAGGATGTACTPDGTPIAGARVAARTHDCQGRPSTVEATTDADGRFVLRGLAPGSTRLVVQSGSFLAEADVDVPEAGTAFAGGGNGKVCFAPDQRRIAVLRGTFDHAERILTEAGFSHEVLCGELGDSVPATRLLQDWERLSAYDLLVVNCGSGVVLRSADPYTARAIENLRRFVREGGSLYVSDLAADFVSRVWPEVLEFKVGSEVPVVDAAEPCCVCGVDCPDTCPLPEDPLTCGLTRLEEAACRVLPRGQPGAGRTGLVTATLEAEFLRRTLGADTALIRFDLSGWMEVARVESGVEVLVSGASPGTLEPRPLVILFRPEPGGGQVAYTSFHTSAQAGETIDALIRALLLRL